MWSKLMALSAVGVLAAMMTAGTAQAAGNDAGGTVKERPNAIVLVTGTLQEADGGSARVDMRATDRTGGDRGNLRFASSEYGQYNGAVRDLTIDGGQVKASGAGPLITPDGKRVRVRFEATFSQDGSIARIVVTPVKGGHAYTLNGKLTQGSVKVLTPDQVRKDKHKAKRG